MTEAKHPQRRRSTSSLRSRLVVVVALLSVSALVLLLWLHRQQERSLVDAASRESLRLAQMAAADYGRIVDSTELLLTVLARVPEIREGPADACRQVLQDVREMLPSYANLGVAHANGDVWCTALQTRDPPSASDRSWFQRALSHRHFVAGEYQVGRVTGVPSLNFAVPMMAEGNDRVEGVVFAALDLAYLSGEGRLPVSGASLTLVDGKGTILARHPDAETWVGKKAPDEGLVDWMMEGPSGTRRMQGLDGSQKIFAFAPVRAVDGLRLSLALGIAEDVVLDRARALAGASVLGLLAVALVAMGGTWLASGWLLVRRIEKLRQQSLRLSEGDLSARSELRHGPDELGQLAAAFDAMAEQLQSAVRVRDDFLSVASHELKTPLTSLGLNLQLMSREVARGAVDRVKDRCESALRQIDRLGRLMETLLQTRRLSEEQLHLRPEPLDLCALASEVVARMREQAQSAKCDLVLEPCDPVHGEWDPLRLDQVVTNLLSNALKYGAGKPVQVQVVPGGLGVLLSVTDQGVGIPKEDQSRLFQRFERAHTAKGFAGIGLGLYVTREIVHAHGGRMHVESTPGEGSRFTVDLPLSPPIRPASP